MRHIYDRIEPEFVRLVNDEVARDKNKVKIARAASASGDWAHPVHIRTGTGLTPAHICTGTGLTLPHLHRDRARPVAVTSMADALPAQLRCRCARRCGYTPLHWWMPSAPPTRTKPSPAAAARCMLHVVCCMLSGARCLLHVVWCTLSGAHWSVARLHVAWWLLCKARLPRLGAVDTHPTVYQEGSVGGGVSGLHVCFCCWRGAGVVVVGGH
jgi:hypothetical protein